VGSYHPRWVNVESGDRRLVTLTFTMRHAHPHYAGRMSLDDRARILATAHGAFGSSFDYFERTRVALVTHGIIDPYLEALAAKVMEIRGTAASAPGP